MTYEQLRQYAADLGVTWDQRLYDGGQSVKLVGTKGEARYSIDWGEEDRFAPIIKSWLDMQPWPTEDDPRVESTGVYE